MSILSEYVKKNGSSGLNQNVVNKAASSISQSSTSLLQEYVSKNGSAGLNSNVVDRIGSYTPSQSLFGAPKRADQAKLYDQYAADIQAYHDATAIRQPLAFGASGATSKVDTTSAKQKYDAAVKGLKSMGATDEDIYNIEHSNARKYTNEAIKKVLLRSDEDIQKAVEQQKMSEAERERRKTTNLSDIQRSIDEQQKIVDAERGKSSANIKAMGGYDPTQVTMAQKRLAELKQEYNLTQQVQQEEKDKKTIADVDKLPTEAKEAVKALIDIRNDPNNAQYNGKPVYSGLDMQLMSMLHSMGYSGEYIQEVMQAYEREGNRVKSEEQRDKYLNDAVRNPVGASVKSVGTNLGSGFGYLENVGDLMSGRPVDYNNLGNRMGQYAQGVRGTVSENLAQQHPFSIAGTNVSSFLYQTGMSMADSSVVAAMSLAGLPEAYGLVLLGGAAANQTMQDAHARGLDDTQAATLGLVAGAAEVITEKVSLDTLLDKAGWNKNAAKQYLKQVLAEGSEEVGADLINWMADVLVSKEQSEWEQSIQNHVAQDDDVRTAFGKAFGEQAGQMVESFVGGALSGGVFGVGGLTYNASNRIQQNRAFDQALNKLYAADPKSMVQTGLTAESGSQFRQLSDKYNKVLEDGGELNADDIRQLSTAAAENWLTDKGSAENAAAVAESIAKKQAGEKLNRQDKKNLKSALAKSYLENAARGSIFRKYGIDVSNDTAEDGNAAESATGASVAIKNAVLRDAVTKAKNGESVTNSMVKNIAANEEALAELGIDTNGMTASEIRTEVRFKVESIASGEAQNVIQNPTTEAVETESASAEYVSNDAITAVAKEYGMSEDSVRDIRDMFKGNMTSEQLRGATQAYRLGRINIPASEMERYNVAPGLTKEQRAYAYNRGAIDNKSSVSKAQNTKKVIKNAKGKGGLVYEGIEDPTKSRNLNAQQRAGLRVAEALSRWAGGTVHVYESVVKDGKRVMAVDIPDAGIKAGESAPNGMYIHSSGEIWIDLAAGNNGEGVTLYTLAHEYTHMIRAWSPAKFDTLAKFLFDQYASNGVSVSELIARQQAKAKKNGRNITYDEAYEEAVADAMERMLADEHFADRIAELKKTDKTLWEKLKDLFKRLIDALGKANKAYKDIAPTTIEAYEVSHFTKAAQEHLAKLYAEAFVDAAEARSSAEVVMAEENESIVPQDDHEGEMSPEDGDIAFSIREKDNIEARSVKYRDAHKDQSSHISDSAFKAANDIINEMAEYMKPFLDKQNKTGKRYLPEEILGKTTFKNGSYGKTIENTTICFRTLAYIDFTNEIKERIGRPLTVEESFLASQMLYDIAKEPQCLYCYVSLDRKAYDEFLLEYTKQRDGVIEKYNALDNKSKANVDALYKEFLNGRKDTKPMRVRFDLWINTAKNGGKFVTNADLTTEEKRSLLKNGGGDLSKQIIDAEKYAQGASWAKKLEQYRSYNSDILSMSATMVNKLNKHYGLRFYSFSEYTPAFIVENMQQIRDASLKGLYGLAYTKKTDFARIFAGTGMNINISTFGRMENGKVVPDTLQGADWEEVKQLRKEHKNVGAVFVATNDEMTEWALAQDWIDVVIPFHIVRTGANVAEFYKWVNNTKDQADVDASGKNKTISPAEFHNDYDTYMSLINERGLTPRFSKWLKNPNYMKLVNETRLSDLDSEKLHPNFDIGAAKASFDAFTEDGGYYGNWYEDGIDYEDAVNTVANDIKAGKRANEVEYGRQDFDASVAMRNRKNRQHGQRVSLSDRDSTQEQKEHLTVDTESGYAVSYSERVNDKDTLNYLNKQIEDGDYITVYRSFQVIDGGLYAPMNAVDRDPNGKNKRLGYRSELGKWEMATESPEIAQRYMDSHPEAPYAKFDLDGVDNKTGGVAYNPYLHASNLVLNDQFSAAYRRNLVTVECRVPMSEANGAYKAKYAKDATGFVEWKPGGVAGKLMKVKPEFTRKLFVSRYMMPVRIIPESEVAQMYKEYLDGTDISVNWNVVTPKLREELEKAGVSVSYNDIKSGGKTIRFDDVFSQAKFSNRDSEGNQLSEGQQEYFKDSKVRDKDGNLLKVYHGTNQGDFNEFIFDKTQRADGGFYGRGHYFTASKGMAELYGSRVLVGYLNIKNPFIWREAVNSYKGRAVSEIAPRNIAARMNMARIFPELFADRKMEYGEYNSNTGEYDEKYIKWSDIEREVSSTEKTLVLTPFADGTYAWFGPGKYWDEQYGNRFDSKEDAETHKFEAAVYAFLEKYDGIGNSMSFDDQTTFTQDFGGEITDALIAMGYDGAMQDREGTEVVAFNSNQFKNADNLNPTENADVRYSYRDADSLDNQTLLTNAKSAKTAEEKDMLNSYMSTAKSLNYQEEKLTGIMEEIRSLDPTQDAKKIAALEREGYAVRKVIEQRHNRLVQLERTKALRDLVKRERSMAVAKQRQKGETALAAQAARSKAKQDAIIEKYRTQRDEAVAKVREQSAQREQEIKDTYRERIKNGVENRKASSLRESIRKTANDFRQMILHATDSKYAPTELMQSCLDVALMLDTSGEREDTKSKQKFRDAMEAIREIKSQYEELQNNPDSDYSLEYDHDFAYMVGQLEKSLKGKAVRDLTLDELQDVHDILHDIKAMLTDAKKQIGKADNVTNYSVGESIINDMGNVGTRTKAEAAIDEQFRLTGSTLRNIRRISNYDDNAALVRLFNDINDGIKKKNQFIMEAEKMFDQFTVNSKRYKQSVNEVKDYKTGGRTFKLTEMEAIQLVLTWERERGGKTNHLERDGAVIPNHELLKKGKYADAFAKGIKYDHITEDEILGIQKSFDEWANNYKAVAKTFFNVKAKTAINNTTLLTKHRAIALTENYIPIEVDRNYIAAELEGVKFDATIEGMGMLKSVKEGAGNPIIIRGLHDVVRNHADRVGQLYGLAVPIRNFNKAFSIRELGTGETPRSAIADAWTQKDVQLIEQAITDLQTPRRRATDALSKIAQKMQGRFVEATLLSNISVTIKQAASYSTAGLYLSQKALAPYQGTIAKIFANNESKFAKNLFAEIDAHTSEHYIRRKGMSMQEISTIANDTSKVVGWMDETLPDAANPLKWIQNMDVATTAALWLAAKKQVELDGIKPSDSSYWEKVTSLYEKVIEDTQPMYDVLHRPEVQKTTNELVRSIIMFRTQPLQNSGILYNAASELAHAKKSGNQQAIAKASKQMKMAVGSQVASLAVFAAMTFLAYAVRNRLGRYKDKDEELTVWSVMGRVLGDMASNGAALALPIGGSTLSGIVEKKITGSRFGGEISVPVVDMVNDYIKSYEKVFGDISDWDSKKGDFAQDLMSLSMDTAGMFGIPANNVYNIVRGVIGNVTDIAGVPLDWATDKSRNYSTQMYNAAIRGDTAKEEKARANYDTEKAADDAFRGEVMKSYEKGKINRDQALKLLMEHGGMKKDAAEEKILNADFKKEYGFSYSDLGEKYIEGVITKEQYKSIQKEHGFKDDEISKKLLDLDFKAKYGFSYDDKKEAYWDGDISKADITKALIAHGKTQEEADDIIKCWDFSKGEGNMDDITVAAVKKYNEYCVQTGMTKSAYYSAWSTLKDYTGEDLDGDGKSDPYTKMDKQLAYIGSLSLSREQKVALALASGIKESSINKRAHW